MNFYLDFVLKWDWTLATNIYMYIGKLKYALLIVVTVEDNTLTRNIKKKELMVTNGDQSGFLTNRMVSLCFLCARGKKIPPSVTHNIKHHTTITHYYIIISCFDSEGVVERLCVDFTQSVEYYLL